MAKVNEGIKKYVIIIMYQIHGCFSLCLLFLFSFLLFLNVFIPLFFFLHPPCYLCEAWNVQLSKVFLLSHFPPEDTIFPSHPFLNLLFFQSHFFLSALWYGNRSVSKKKNVWEILSDLLIFSHKVRQFMKIQYNRREWDVYV